MISLMRLLNEVINNPKAILLAGAPGSGKGSILSGLNLNGLKMFNLDDMIIALSKADGFSLDQKNANAEDRSKFMVAMQAATKNLKNEVIPQAIINRDSFILDGTSASVKQTTLLKDQLEEAGYNVLMLYVYADLEDVLKRNQERFKLSGGTDRSLTPAAVYSTWADVTKNFDVYKEMFGNNFVPVSTAGKTETMNDVSKILQTYITPFLPKDPKPKTEKEIARSSQQKRELNAEVQSILSSNRLKNIINVSVSKEQAQSKINSFLGK